MGFPNSMERSFEYILSSKSQGILGVHLPTLRCCIRFPSACRPIRDIRQGRGLQQEKIRGWTREETPTVSWAVNKSKFFQLGNKEALQGGEDISAEAQGSDDLAKVGGRVENPLSTLQRKERLRIWGRSAKQKGELYVEEGKHHSKASLWQPMESLECHFFIKPVLFLTILTWSDLPKA